MSEEVASEETEVDENEIVTVELEEAASEVIEVGDFADEDDVVVTRVATQSELPIRPSETGDPRVDDAVALLDDLDGLATPDHVAVFDDVQRRLQSALTHSDVDSGTGS